MVTMDKSSAQHHYVPRFYLSQFASKARRINIYNLEGKFVKEDISLREQCRRPNYYKDPSIEAALGRMEEEAAKALRILMKDPTPRLSESILRFIAAQILRTPSSVKISESLQGKLLHHLGATHQLSESQLLALGAIPHDQLPIYHLIVMDDLVNAMEDLRFLMFNLAKSVLITSDNPVVKYNQYYERVRGMGTTGVGQKGLQIFLPLSPSHLLVLYDGNIYDHVKSRRPTENDIDSINAFQIVSAETNVYFSDWTHKDRLTDLVLEKRYLRSTDATVLKEFESDADENGSLVVSYAEPPNLGLNLSFLQVKKRASRVSMGKRIGNSQRQARPVTRGARTGKAITYSKLVAKI